MVRSDTFGQMDRSALRETRRATGLTLRSLARAVGSSAPNLSAYERGAKRPNPATRVRIEAALGAGGDSPIFRRNLVTVPAAAAAIRAGLRHGWTTADLLRIVRELRSNANHLVDDADRAAFYAAPSTTGDPRWDALLAAVTEMDALREERPVPAWARGHDLSQLWFVGSSPGLHPHALVRSPSSLAARGIVLDGAVLGTRVSAAPLLDGEEIRRLLADLGRRLAAKGITARLFLVGGAALALAYNDRRATRDLDAVFEPKTEIYAEAALLAEEQGLPDDWLNDGVKGLLPDRAAAEVGSHFEAPGISVEVASPTYLFAMKAAAARAEIDADDLRFLASHLGLTDVEEALALVEHYYSPHRLKPVTRFLIEEVVGQRPAEGSSGGDTAPSTTSEPGRRVRPYRRADGTVVRGYRRRR